MAHRQPADTLKLIYETLIQIGAVSDDMHICGITLNYVQKWKRTALYRLECSFPVQHGPTQPQTSLFRVQLHKNLDGLGGGYVVDLVHLEGSLCVFLHTCSVFRQLLQQPK